MRVVWLMIRKDLLRKLRSPLGVTVVLAFPILFSLMIALAFGGGTVPRVHLLVENRDDEFFGGALMSALASDEVAEYFDVEVVGEDGRDLIEKGKGSALLTIPEGFSQDLVDGEPTALRLLRNPAQGIMPEVAEQLAGVLTEVMSAGSRVLRAPLDRLAPFVGEGNLEITDETVASVAVAIHHTAEGAEKFLFPPVIDLTTVQLDEDGTVVDEKDEEVEEENASADLMFTIFLFVFPGVSVYALFLVGDIGMRDILAEADAGTLRRQVQGPVSARTVILAKTGYSAVLAIIALAVLSLTGWIAMDGAVDLIAYAVLSLALVLAVTGAGAAIYGSAGSQGRGATISAVVYLFLAFAGGSFIELSNMPRPVRFVAPASPFFWGTEGYRTLLQAEGGLGDIVPHAGILAAMGIVLLATGAVLLGRRMKKGVA